MTPDLHALAYNLAVEITTNKWEGLKALVEIIERAFANLQATHEAERIAAIVEALERAAQIFDGEEAAAKFHEVYQQEAHRRGDVRHPDAYDELSEAIKEWDRALARYCAAAIRSLKPRSDLMCVPKNPLEELLTAVRDMEESGIEITELVGHAWAELTSVLAAAEGKPPKE